ncbi:MAG: hypothetical protein OEM91_12675 [Hyphomicrobiales bacterium]|nr:hypothetical protein [Hyphomicrobiales bacterium]
MKAAALIVALVLQAAWTGPVRAQMCDTRCDEGEVWTELDGGTCIPEPKPMA